MTVKPFNHAPYEAKGGFKGNDYIEYLEAQYAHYKEQYDELIKIYAPTVEQQSAYFMVSKQVFRLKARIELEKKKAL